MTTAARLSLQGATAVALLVVGYDVGLAHALQMNGADPWPILIAALWPASCVVACVVILARAPERPEVVRALARGGSPDWKETIALCEDALRARAARILAALPAAASPDAAKLAAVRTRLVTLSRLMGSNVRAVSSATERDIRDCLAIIDGSVKP